MDKIYIEGMEFYAYHGVLEEEKKLGQRFIVDVEISCMFGKACESDIIDDTMSYAEIYDKIKAVVENNKFNLLERLAQAIADRVKEDKRCIKIRVKINKPSAPVNGIFKRVGVEIER